MTRLGPPTARGLYDPRQEKDSCGVALVANIRGEPSHSIVADGLTALIRMAHRSAVGPEENTGDGAGILIALPHAFMAKVAEAAVGCARPEPGRDGPPHGLPRRRAWL